MSTISLLALIACSTDSPDDPAILRGRIRKLLRQNAYEAKESEAALRVVRDGAIPPPAHSQRAAIPPPAPRPGR